ncbi:MAG TPA: MgtC/SapB family protein [Rhizorhapis sp.]|nr:MgtC/SapB family protein [Rhizorhapis sp.]
MHAGGMDALLSRLAVALAIGLLVGLERGWHTRDQEEGKRAAGLRTFALSGLLGGVAGAMALATNPVVLGLCFIGYAGVFAAFQWLEAKENKDLGATTVVAGLLTFALGAYGVLGDLRIAVAATVAMTLVLALREPLHRWIAALRWEEIRSGLILLTMTFLLLPVLPNRPIDPWQSVNPAEIWLFAIMIAAISFGGYVAIRALGDRAGVVMAAIAGGLASSTATTLTLARLGKEQPDSSRLLAGGILIAGVVMAVRVFVVASLLNRALLPVLWPPLLALALVMGAAAALLLFGDGKTATAEIRIDNPLELGTAIKLAALIAIVLLAAEVVRDMVGESAVLAVSAISGIADVDAITISMARLGGQQLSLALGMQAIALAVGVNTLAKAVMTAWVGGTRIGAYAGLASALAVAAGGAALLAGQALLG